jgi:hypothetical protein
MLSELIVLTESLLFCSDSVIEPKMRVINLTSNELNLCLMQLIYTIDVKIGRCCYACVSVPPGFIMSVIFRCCCFS